MSQQTNRVRYQCSASSGAGAQTYRTAHEFNHLQLAASHREAVFLATSLDGVRETGQQFDPRKALESEPQSRELRKKSMALSPGQFLTERHRKDLIVLHFTAGTSCESAYRTWEGTADRIATAYGVDPDGSIVEFFPPECWAFHLGVKGTLQHDQRSIGIEIANVGPLKPDPRNASGLNWWPNNWGARYCTLAETERYREATFRGIRYFAAMPEIQQRAVGVLVRELCDRFSIPREASSVARSGEFDPQAFASYQGVATHSNFRRDKWDVGPAFDWDFLAL